MLATYIKYMIFYIIAHNKILYILCFHHTQFFLLLVWNNWSSNEAGEIDIVSTCVKPGTIFCFKAIPWIESALEF